MDYAQAARRSLAAAEKASGDHLTTAEAATLDALQAIAYAVLDGADTLERIDDALRNTIGGRS